VLREHVVCDFLTLVYSKPIVICRENTQTNLGLLGGRGDDWHNMMGMRRATAGLGCKREQ